MIMKKGLYSLKLEKINDADLVTPPPGYRLLQYSQTESFTINNESLFHVLIKDLHAKIDLQSYHHSSLLCNLCLVSW